MIFINSLTQNTRIFQSANNVSFLEYNVRNSTIKRLKKRIKTSCSCVELMKSTPSGRFMVREELPLNYQLQGIQSIENECSASCVSWGFRRFIRDQRRHYTARPIKYIHTYFEMYPSPTKIMFGPPISPIFHSQVALPISWLSWTGIHVTCSPGGSQTQCTETFVLKPSLMHLIAVNRMCSIPIKGVNSHPTITRKSSRITRSRSAWMGEEGPSTMSGSSGCGLVSNTKKYTSTTTTASLRHGSGWGFTSNFTTINAGTNLLTTRPLPSCTDYLPTRPVMDNDGSMGNMGTRFAGRSALLHLTTLPTVPWKTLAFSTSSTTQPPVQIHNRDIA